MKSKNSSTCRPTMLHSPHRRIDACFQRWGFTRQPIEPRHRSRRTMRWHRGVGDARHHHLKNLAAMVNHCPSSRCTSLPPCAKHLFVNSVFSDENSSSAERCCRLMTQRLLQFAGATVLSGRLTFHGMVWMHRPLASPSHRVLSGRL